MADPSDIRQRREAALRAQQLAEQEEADFLLRELLRGAGAIDNAVTDARTEERTSARLRGEDPDGGIVPRVGIPSAPLPETFADELAGRLAGGNDHVAMELLRAEADRPLRPAAPAEPATAPARRDPREGELFARQGIAPSLWDAIPGPQRNDAMVLPETEDWGAYGRVGGELAAADEARHAPMAVPAARPRSSDATTDATTDALRQQMADRAQFGRSLGEEMPPVQVPGTDTTYSPGATLQGMLDTLSLGHSDELQALGDYARHGGNYEAWRERRDREARQLREENPWSYALGGFSQAPAMLMTGPSTAGLAPNVARAVNLGTGVGMAGLAAHGASSAPLASPQRQADTRAGMELGGMFGVGGELAAEGVRRAAPTLQRAADYLDEWSAPLRVRGAIGNGQRALEQVGELPGGFREAADNLNRYGISPRGSWHSVDTARRRAHGAWDESNQVLDRVFDRMGAEEQADDVVARYLSAGQPAAPSPAAPVTRAGRANVATAPTLPGPPSRSAAPVRMTDDWDGGPRAVFDTDPIERVARIRAAAREARAPGPSGPYREPLRVAPPPRGRVDLEPVAQILDDVAERNARLPGQGPVVQGARDLAGEYRQHGGRRTFREAQDLVQALDQPANWNASTSPVGSRLPAVAERAREMRRGVRNAQREAVSEVDPSLGAAYDRGREENQIARIVASRGEYQRVRDAANRQISPSDYWVGIPAALSEGGSLWKSAAGVVGNRFLRGREATLGAAGAERIADILRSRAQPLQGVAPRAGMLAGGTQAQRPAQPAPAPVQVSQEEWDALSAPEQSAPQQDDQPTQVSQEEWDLLFGDQP